MGLRIGTVGARPCERFLPKFSNTFIRSQGRAPTPINDEAELGWVLK